MKNDDIFGQAFLEFLVHNSSHPIDVEIDHEEQDQLDPAYFFRSFEQMPALEQHALKLARGKVLDVGAAAGCHSRWLHEHEIDVTSLEISAGACEVMRLNKLPKVVEADFFAFEPEERFDTLLFLMNGLGMGQTVEGTVRLLQKAKQLLAPGGVIIGDSSDIAYFALGDSPSAEDLAWLNEQKKGLLTQSPFPHYYGMVHFSLKWKQLENEFSWIYPDPDLLKFAADRAELKMVKLADGPHHDFLFAFSA
jgi:SAM-dependent methyltransferase